MVQTLIWLFLIILPSIRASDATKNDINIQRQTSAIQNSPTNEDIEDRLERMEALLEEKLEKMHAEARVASRQLQAEVHSTLTEFQADLTRIIQQANSGIATTVQQSNTILKKSVEDLDKDVKTLTTAATLLTSDITDLKNNVDSLITDNRESNRRLKAIEWQPTVVNTTLKGLQADLSKIIQQVSAAPATPMQQSNTKLETAVENLHNDVKNLKTFLTSDVNDLKKNVSSLINDTRSMLESTSHFLTKQCFNKTILDPMHHESTQISSESLTILPKNCKEIKESGQTNSGIYKIQPEHSIQPISVVCEMQTRGGGWTVIQNRFNGSQDFFQNWVEYKNGFGNLSGEFWLGLDTIHQLTGYHANEFLIELQDFELQNRSAYYTKFSVGPEADGFPLNILEGYSGDAGDSLLYSRGSKFSTKDVDQDTRDWQSCAQAYGGAWWYKSCAFTNLNAKYYVNGTYDDWDGMFWDYFRGFQYSLRKTRMLVRL